MCQPQHKQFVQPSSSTPASFVTIHQEQEDGGGDSDEKQVTVRLCDMNKSLTMQYAQGFSLLLVVFTYVRRSGTISDEQMSLLALDECPAYGAIAASNDDDIYFPGSSWAIPYFIVGVYCMMRFTKFLSHGIEKLQHQRRRTVVHIQANLTKVPSREALSRISSQVSSICKSISTTCNNNINQLATLSSANQIPAITSPVCFARSDYIEQLSVTDITTIFQYATLVNQDMFDRKSFTSKQNKLIRAMVTAMDVAVQLSRGSSATHFSKAQQLEQQKRQHAQKKVEQEGEASPSSLSSSEEESHADNTVASTGNMDALYFVAAARIFAEWRVVRLVPPGYKRYAFSINLARRDMLQNLMHIENAVHGYLKQIQQSQVDGPNPNNHLKIQTPTLRTLLQYEVNTQQMHKRLPYLDADSAALGLLWTKRQIEYQTAIFDNSLGVPTQFRSTKDAALAAYETVYKPYHGWAVQQVFKSSFGSSPAIDDIWRHLDPPIRLLKSKTENDFDEEIDSEESHPPQLLSHLSSSNDWDDSDGENVADDTEQGNELVLALDEIGRNLVGAWDEAMQFLSRFVCVVPDSEHHHHKRNLIMSHESYLQMSKLLDPTLIDASELVLSESGSEYDIMDGVFRRSNSVTMSIGDTSEPFLTSVGLTPVVDVLQKVKTNVKDHINAMEPMVKDWDNLISELKMNDPSKV